MGTPQIGDTLSLLSKYNFRYRGVLASVDVKECTIGLARVCCYGTEGRSSTLEVSGSDTTYDYIIFRARDIKDLSVVDHEADDVEGGKRKTRGSNFDQPPSAVIDDPAIVSQSPGPFAFEARPMPGSGSTLFSTVSSAAKQSSQATPPQATQNSHRERRAAGFTEARGLKPSRFTPIPLHSVEKATIEGSGVGADSVPNEDFDFEKANQQFRKEAGDVVDAMDELGLRTTPAEDFSNSAMQHNSPSSDDSTEQEGKKDGIKGCYDKSLSFFDSISCGSHNMNGGERIRGTTNWLRSMRTNEETFGVAAAHTGFPPPPSGPPRYALAGGYSYPFRGGGPYFGSGGARRYNAGGYPSNTSYPSGPAFSGGSGRYYTAPSYHYQRAAMMRAAPGQDAAGMPAPPGGRFFNSSGSGSDGSAGQQATTRRGAFNLPAARFR